MSQVQLGPVTRLSPADVMALWVSNGGDPTKAAIAAAIVFSSENPAGNAGLVNDTASTGDYSVGLFQINYMGSLLQTRTNQFGSPQDLANDPNLQAQAAIAMSSNGTNWQAWGPDLGYSGYGERVTDPLPGSRVANWLAAHHLAQPGFGQAAGAVLAGVGIFGLSWWAAELIMGREPSLAKLKSDVVRTLGFGPLKQGPVYLASESRSRRGR